MRSALSLRLFSATLALASTVVPTSPAAAQDAAPVLVKDIAAGTTTSDPNSFAEVNGTVFFAAFPLAWSGGPGVELWKTDGTPGGTLLVKDINPGNGSSSPSFLIKVGATLFFRATGGTATGTELWKSDGTEAGTVLVKDINPGAGSSSVSRLVDVAGILFFSANDGVNGPALWKSDGTTAGTVMVKDIRPDASNPGIIGVTAVGATLYFVADDGVSGQELWKSDGTTAGTVLVKDINPGAASAAPSGLRNLGGVLTFGALEPTVGRELWRSDGTAAGTVLVKDINPGAAEGSPGAFTVVGTTLYFRADDGVGGGELWKSDGTASGTVLVKDIIPGSLASNPFGLIAVGSTLMFVADDGVSGLELWRSDGSAAGTALVADLTPGPAGSEFGEQASTNGILYFVTGDPVAGTELWSTDGTAGDTHLVVDIVPGSGSSSPEFLLGVGGAVYFRAAHPTAGIEPFRSDGTVGGTVLLGDLATAPQSSAPQAFTNVRGTLYFSAYQPATGSELWRSDGTAPGTAIVKDVDGRSGNGAPLFITELNGAVLYSGNEAATGRELWRTDGTAAGTAIVKDINAGTASSTPSSLVALGSRVYFAASDGVSGTELWASDGTAGGTVLLVDIAPGPGSGSPANLVNVNGTLFFSSGTQIWKSDGTAGGTAAVFDLATLGSSGPARFTNAGGRLFFTAAGAAGPELWMSDTANQRVGATGATTRLRVFLAGSQVHSLTNVRGFVLFSASDTPASSNTGQELWMTDGTVGGTVLVKDIAPGAASSDVASIVAGNGTVLFVATDAAAGREIWRTDGSAAGTVLVKDILPGTGSAAPSLLTNVNGTVFFKAEGPPSGIELWKTDGNAAGTVLVADIAPGSLPSGPAELTNVNGTLFFSAESPSTGREVYKMSLGLPQPTAGPVGPQYVGGQNTVFGANFTPAAVVKYFVATAAGPMSVGPFTPSSYSQTALGVFVPPDVLLGNGFAAVQVINTDAGYRESNVTPSLLFGDPADNIPSIFTINGSGLPPAELSIGVAHIDTVVAKGSTVTIAGTGFNAPVVNVFTAAGNIGPLPALSGGTSTQFQIAIPAGAPTGPGNFQVVNTVGYKASNAVSSVLGAAPSITSVSVSGTTVTVHGTGFCSLSVINLFNLQGGAAVNLGGLAGGVAAVPLTIVSDTQFTFQRPAGAVTGPAFVEVLNPPFIPFASSGNDADGAFNFPAPVPSLFTDIGVGDAADRAAAALAGAAAAAPDNRTRERGDGGAARRGVRTERVVWTRATVGAAIAGEDLGARPVAGNGEGALSVEPTRPIGPPATGRAGARSTRAVLRGDGAVSWRVEGDGDAAAGFGHDDADGLLRDLDFALRVVAGTRELRVVERGVERARVGAYAPGDRLRVTVRDGVVEYWRNAALLWTSSAAPRYPLVVDASLAGAGRVTGARVRGELGTLVEWRSDSPGVRVGSTRVTAERALRVTTPGDDAARAVEAMLDGRAGLGLATRDGRLAYRLVRDGFRVRAEHAGVVRGTWTAAEGTRLRVAVGRDGVVRYLADGQVLDAAPLADGSPLGTAGWLDGPGAGIGQATCEGAPQ